MAQQPQLQSMPSPLPSMEGSKLHFNATASSSSSSSSVLDALFLFFFDLSSTSLASSSSSSLSSYDPILSAVFFLLAASSLAFYTLHPRRISCTTKAVLVTGAASGIGRATSELLLSRGCFVYALDVNKPELERLFSGRTGVRIIHADVTKQNDIDEAVKIVEEEQRGLWGIVNSAGILRVPRPDRGACGTIELGLEQDINPVFDVNFFGIHRVTSSFMPFLLNSKGRVVNISSVLGRFAVRFVAPYCASKFALEGYSDCLRRELREVGVKVCIVEPGYTDTPLVAKERFTKILVDPSVTRFCEPIASGLSKSMKSFNRNNLQPPRVVADAIYDALFCESPKARYLVVHSSLRKALFAVLFTLPDCLLDPIARILVD